MEYLLHVLILIGIYLILATGLNLIAGYAGLLSIAHAAFFGIGAYTAALMALNLHSPMLVNLVCATVLAGAFGAVVGMPSLRIRDDYFVIVTFAFQVIVFNVLNNWVSFTGGPMGLPGIPQPVLFGWTISSHFGFLLLVGCCCMFVMWICHRLVRSPFGRVLKAIREDEVFAQSAGKNVAAYKVLVFVIGAAMAAVAGVLYAHYISFIDPTSFTVMESIFIISIVIIGGAGSPWGPIVGAVVLVTLPELLRFVGLPSGVAANTRQILYGAALVACMMWRPQGLLGEYTFQKGVRPAMSDTLLEINGLQKTFDGIFALDDFSCAVGKGEIVGLIGPNGAGKTTLFNVATGFLRPEHGRIAYKGRRLLGLLPYQVRRAGVARTFQDLRLIRQMSVLENVLLSFPDQPGERLGHVFFRWKTSQTREAANRRLAMSLLGDAGLSEKADDPAEALSYGQQKLLSLVCCLAGNAELLLLDEPVAGIAPAMIEKILLIIRDLPKQGKSVVLIEHNLEAVMQVCNRVIFMDAGRKISEGTPEQVRNDPRVIEAYID